MKLAVIIQEQIADGELVAGERLPSIDDLRLKHQHSRQTVGKAMKHQEAMHLICRVPGLGWFVEDE